MKSCIAWVGVLLCAVLTCGSASAAPPATRVELRNELPDTYQLRRVRLWIDGAPRYDGAAPFAQALPPGDHVVAVAAEYQLRDPWFSYMRGYRIRVESAERVRAGTPRLIVARVVQAGGVTTPVERNAQIVWR